MGRTRKTSNAPKPVIPESFRPISIHEGPGRAYAAVYNDPAQGQLYYLEASQSMGPLSRAELESLQLAIADVLDGTAVYPLS